jgi:heptose-I-phosphate ethanolaminephosphotransferase
MVKLRLPRLSLAGLKARLPARKDVFYVFVILAAVFIAYFTTQYGIYTVLVSEMTLVLFLSLMMLFGRWALPVYVFFALVVTFELVYHHIFHERISVGVLGSSLESNSREAGEMLSEYLSSVYLFVGVFVVFLIPAITCRKNKLAGSGLFLASMVIVVSTFHSAIGSISHDKARERFFRSHFVGNALHNKLPFFWGDTSYALLRLYQNHFLYAKRSHAFPSDAVAGKARPVKEDTIVVVIGEASQRMRYSLYGYHVETTPFLDSLVGRTDPMFCYFKKVHSSANLTRYSVPMTFSFDTPDNQSAVFKQKNLVELANEAGFETYWISAQPDESRVNNKISYIANYAKHTVFRADLSKGSMSRDIKMLPFVRKALKGNARKKFIVVHLYGSHLRYKYRYDKIDKKALPHASAYDRSIHHTDRVLKGVVGLLHHFHKQYALFYSPDHGEVVGRGHGYVADDGRQLFVPLVYISNTTDRCSFIESLRGKDGWISGLSNKFILLDMMGYKPKRRFVEKQINNDRIYRSNAMPTDFMKELHYKK